jgi:hypothetical protein
MPAPRVAGQTVAGCADDAVSENGVIGDDDPGFGRLDAASGDVAGAGHQCDSQRTFSYSLQDAVVSTRSGKQPNP